MFNNGVLNDRHFGIGISTKPLHEKGPVLMKRCMTENICIDKIFRLPTISSSFRSLWEPFLKRPVHRLRLNGDIRFRIGMSHLIVPSPFHSHISIFLAYIFEILNATGSFQINQTDRAVLRKIDNFARNDDLLNVTCISFKTPIETV